MSQEKSEGETIDRLILGLVLLTTAYQDLTQNGKSHDSSFTADVAGPSALDRASRKYKVAPQTSL